ncbi:hypothetical protein [Serratia symbiotica]|uniref:hypothetical protein n=1 Tax=Serratia symbiotica TaxID=138074 RepID=UPI00132609FB|nr:hypothetical protein [Serratia symbiotica]QTP13373.1 hypothetical protein GPZ83_0000090 [Serratia symbiotica]
MRFRVDVSNLTSKRSEYKGEVIVDNDLIDSEARSEVEAMKADIRTHFHKMHGADMIVTVEAC